MQPVPSRPLAALPRSSRTRVYQTASTDSIVQRIPRPADVVARRFSDGAVCFVAESAGNLVGFIWIRLDRYVEDEVRCEYVLEPVGEVAWDFDAYVAPEFRMTRAFVQLWEAANEHLRRSGYLWTASRISAFNPASLASHQRFGAERRHTAVFLVVGPFQLALLSLPPYVHLSARQASRPALVLNAASTRARTQEQ
jgi:GNAT superfamily N-acetyltransferase